MKNDKNRKKTRVAVYMVGFVESKILLGKRINVDHMNNHWSLPAGHVYESESIIDAAIRESKEELGIVIKASDLTLIGSLYQRSNNFDYANYIFLIDLKDYKIINKEPEKCESLEFFDINSLPHPIASYINLIIHKSFNAQKPWIDVIGF